ncbi:MAG TPA: pseudouridine synthase [Woeseiaceae bacterium]|nr:pseudouridine synthase [Woeseiaceae bacterium]
MPLILLNKPFRVLSQFTDDAGRRTLADYIDTAAVYPAGRLDFDSEGLLLLTDDGRMQARVSQPRSKIVKTYWAQVEGSATNTQLNKLEIGVKLKDGPARALRVRPLAEPDNLWPRDPPIRYRANIATSWLEILLLEGRNRQVRRMTAAIGLPTLRLIRAAIGPFSLDSLQPGEYRQIANNKAWAKLSAQ